MELFICALASALVCALVSALVGSFVAVWALLKGLRAAMIVKNGGLPDNLFTRQAKNPEDQSRGEVQSRNKTSPETPSFSEQLGALFGTQKG